MSTITKITDLRTIAASPAQLLKMAIAFATRALRVFERNGGWEARLRLQVKLVWVGTGGPWLDKDLLQAESDLEKFSLELRFHEDTAGAHAVAAVLHSVLVARAVQRDDHTTARQGAESCARYAVEAEVAAASRTARAQAERAQLAEVTRVMAEGSRAATK